MSTQHSGSGATSNSDTATSLGTAWLDSGRVPDDWPSFYGQAAESTAGVEYTESLLVTKSLNTFYDGGVAYLSQCLGDVDMVAVDIETTGLNHKTDEIVSVGLVEFSAQRIQLASAKHWLVRPQRLSHTSVVVHGITHSDLSAAPSIDRILPELLAVLAGKLVVVHYRAMEREFFRKVCPDSKAWLFPVVDTFAVELSSLSAKQTWWRRFLNKPLPSLRLPDARLRYALPDYQNHNALIDAIATAELLQAQIQKWKLSQHLVKDIIV